MTLAVKTILQKLALCAAIYSVETFTQLTHKENIYSNTFNTLLAIIKTSHNKIFTSEGIMRIKLNTNLPRTSAEIVKLTVLLTGQCELHSSSDRVEVNTFYKFQK